MDEAINTKRIPTTFIIYKLSESHRQMLLQRQVWALKNISFCMAPLEPSCPDFLFTIKNFPNLTLEKASVVSTVKEVWNNDTSQHCYILGLV